MGMATAALGTSRAGLRQSRIDQPEQSMSALFSHRRARGVD